MAEMEMRMNPFEDVYAEFFMEKAIRLGSGSFGKVYLIQSRKDGGTYAAKYQQLSGSNSKRSVRIEAEMLSRLYKQKRMESSILVLVGYYETSLHTLLVTEYLEGGELFNKITDSSYCLTERKCRGFIKQIIQGLNYIHHHGIIHLDIKPQNIMLTHPNRDDIKLIDFGLAKLMKDGKIFASFTGTIGFMAPEVLNCSQAGPGTDFFSLGVVAYMLLSGGYEPFWLNNEEKTIKRTLHMEIKYLQILSPSANSFLSGLLAKQLTERLHGLACLSHPWVQGIQEEQDSSMEKVVNTMHIKSYMARTRWGKAIRAVRFAVRMKAVVVPNLPGVYPDIQYPDFISTEIPIYV